MTAPLPVVLVGAGSRARLHSRVLTVGFGDAVELVGVVGRGEARAHQLGDELGLPWSLTLDDAAGWGARAAVVAVSCHHNGEVARDVLARGLPALLETPLAMTASDATELASSATLTVEVAEQNPRFPEVRFWRRVVEEGFVGEVRMIASDGAGYRYHATAVARALLGRPEARRAVGMRVLTGVDLGRGVDREPLLTGSVLTDGGAVFQLREGEGHHLGGDAPWLGGGWRILCDGGTIGAAGAVRRWRDGRGEDLPVERVAKTIDGVDVTQAWRLHAEQLLEVPSPLPGAPLDDDDQAVAGAVQDWLARLDGASPATSWTMEDAVEDLRWIEALERSAILGGAPVGVTRGA